jgi:hypothetical protein
MSDQSFVTLYLLSELKDQSAVCLCTKWQQRFQTINLHASIIALPASCECRLLAEPHETPPHFGQTLQRAHPAARVEEECASVSL